VIRRATKPILCISLFALALPALAQASPFGVIKDCQDGRLDKKHSRSDLQNAQDNLPTDIDEYGDCRELIAAALAGGSDRRKGRGGGGGGGGGSHSKRGASAPARQGDQAAKAKDEAALDQITSSGKKPRVSVGGKEIAPGDNGLFNLASAANGLPLPLLLALIAVGLLAVGGAVPMLRRRVPALAGRIPLMSKLNLPRVRLPRLLRR